MVVGSRAVLLFVLESLPPETVAELITVVGEAAVTSTVKVSVG